MTEQEFNKEGLRNFKAGEEGKVYYIVAPSAEFIRGADWEYSKTYTKSLVEGITTTAEMTDILMRRGVIGPEFEQRSQELSQELADQVGKLNEANTMESKQEMAVGVAQAREELFQWNQRLNAPLANTCEQIADDARLEFLTSCIVVGDEGDRVWPDLDSYLTEQSQGLAQKSRFEIMLYLQGLSSDFLEQTPEAVAMREVETEVLSNIKAEIKKASEAEEEAAKAKKPARKKAPAKKTTRKPRAAAKKTAKPRAKKTE